MINISPRRGEFSLLNFPSQFIKEIRRLEVEVHDDDDDGDQGDALYISVVKQTHVSMLQGKT